VSDDTTRVIQVFDPHAFEKQVRPVETIKLRPDYPDQLSKAPPPEKTNVVVWGSAGQSVFQLRASSQSKIDNKWPESKRTYDVVRVYNPDDRDQFIDTEVMTAFEGRNKISQDRIQIRFGVTQNTKNSEVVQKGLTRTQPSTG
jgi:hypothetical protein